MYNKEIYQEWEMHQDATQLEIKYKFLVKVIDILTIKALVQNIDGQAKKITNNSLIKEWQTYELDKIINNFYTIINDAADLRTQLDLSFSTFEKAIFLLSIVINTLKQTNYKANEIEIYYEPRLFLIAQKNLKMKTLEKWTIQMSSRVYQIPVTDQAEQLFDFNIKINQFNLNNVIWYLENLCLSFKEISTWYNNLFLISNIDHNDKNIAINIMNHMIVYFLTDFYVKITYLQTKNKNFNYVYNNVLTSIRNLLNEGKFAINAFKAIANFIAKILADGYIKRDDDIIKNFLEIIRISCSYNNKKYFEEQIFKLSEESSNVNNDENCDNELDLEQELNHILTNQKTNQITLDNTSSSNNYTTPIKQSETTSNDTLSSTNDIDNQIKHSQSPTDFEEITFTDTTNEFSYPDDEISDILKKKTEKQVKVTSPTISFNNNPKKNKEE